MAETFVEVVTVDSIDPHPNADKLEVATIKGATVVVGKGSFEAGSHAAYFPPNILLPDELADRLGVTKYLKHAEYQAGEGASQCRVGGCRLRGQPSFGFLASLANLGLERAAFVVGENLDESLGTKKYVPPVRVTTSDAAADHALFHKYTDIENISRYPNAIPDGTPVRITEKIHGTNSRVGMVDGELMAGSHGLRRKRPIEGRSCMYWEPLDIPGVKDLLEEVARISGKAVILFGEVYGAGVQDMDYGTNGKRGYRIFDVSVGGVYQDWDVIESMCQAYQLQTVPLLYEGPFSRAIVDEHTYGKTTIGEPRSAFKGREGVVVTPLKESFSDVLGGRLILKSISADYLDRKGAEDND